MITRRVGLQSVVQSLFSADELVRTGEKKNMGLNDDDGMLGFALSDISCGLRPGPNQQGAGRH
jgi:hypothetical protein